MGGVIVVNRTENWFYAGWAYRIIMERLAGSVSIPEDRHTVFMADVVQTLSLDRVPPDQAARLARALSTVIPELQEELRRDGNEPIDYEFADYLDPLLESLLVHYGHDTP